MERRCDFPDPIQPGQFDLAEFDGNSLYNSRWASHTQVAEGVLAGKYDLLTPVVSEFIPTLSCTFRCPTCHYRKPKEKVGIWQNRSDSNRSYEMTVEEGRVYIDKLAQGGCQAILFSGGGEPTMHPYLRQIVEHAKDRKLRISMSTNGTFAGGGFKPEETITFGFDNVRVSLDTIEDHDTFHGYNKSKRNWCRDVLDNLSKIVETKRGRDADTRITVCIIFDKRNYKEIPELGNVISKFNGVNSVVIRPVIDYFGENQVPKGIIEEVGDLIKTEFQPILAKSGIEVFVPKYRQIALGHAKREYSECRGCGLIGGVWPDGRMFMCTEANGFDEFYIGDLSSQTLKEIYSSARYLELRQQVGSEGFIKCPVTCRPTTLNLIFDRIEKLRANDTSQQLGRWVKALQMQHSKPCPWIQV